MHQARRRHWALFLCAAQCALFAAIAWAAVSRKSATIDEPRHCVTGWFMLYAHDFRLSAEVAPLWEYWISLPMGADAIHFDPNSPAYKNIKVRRDIATWENQVLYQPPDYIGVALTRRGRIMALILGVVLAVLICRWSWRLAGPVAGIAALFTYAWDPNFLGHAPLAKNDVAIALAYVAAAYGYWRVGERLNVPNALLAIAATTAAILTKFSGLLLGPVMLIVLGCRALDRRPWFIMGSFVADRRRKLAALAALAVVTPAFVYAAIWAAYGFRFDAGPNGLQLDTAPYVSMLRDVQTFKQTRRQPTPAELAAWQMPLSTRAVLYAETHKLLPQAFLVGYLITQGGSESRLCFLNGSFYNGGKWYYFPLATLYKSPLATLFAIVIAVWIGVSTFRRGIPPGQKFRWAAIALGVPAAAYAAIAFTSNINIGLRHFFPFYPFLFIAIGLAAARFWKSGVPARIIILAIALGLAVETAAAFPDYISFFDCLIGQRAGYELLSDSNIDWGQDLPLLAEWQRNNPNVPLYLDYQGECDPRAYGIKYYNVYGGFEFGPPKVMPDRPGVLAVSATKLHLATPTNGRRVRRLQSANAANPTPEEDDAAPLWYGLIAGRQPDLVLGGSIYLFHIDPHKTD